MSDSAAPRVRLNFNFPYAHFLMMYNVPQTKWEAFYERFGDTYHKGRTPDEEHGRALLWMMANAEKTGGSVETTPAVDSKKERDAV